MCGIINLPDPVEGVLAKLDTLAKTKPGDELPDFLAGFNNWGVELSKLAEDAAKIIRHYRSVAGAVSQGPSVSDIKTAAREGREV